MCRNFYFPVSLNENETSVTAGFPNKRGTPLSLRSIFLRTGNTAEEKQYETNVQKR